MFERITLGEPSERLRELVGVATLCDISHCELSARRGEDPDPEAGFDVGPVYGLYAAIHATEPRFLLRLKVSIEGSFGTLVVETQAEYSVAAWPRDALSQALIVEYANHVGTMAMIPYARQGLASLSQQVFGTPLLMPVMRPGEIAFPLPGANDQG